MKRILEGLFLVASLLALSCSTQWTLRTEKSEIPLSWPYPPEEPKVTFLAAIRGFEAAKESRSPLRTLVYGSDGNGDDLFRLPVAVSVGSDGRMAVADVGRRCVHLYIPSLNRYIRISGGPKEPFGSPVGVAFDEGGRLYVSDSVAAKIFVFGSDGASVLQLAETGSGKLKRPTGIAYNPAARLLYVTDTLANRVYAFDETGKVVLSFGGRGEENGKFNFPTHLFCSPSGDIYVSDAMNFRVEIFSPRGEFLGSFGRQGDGSGDLAMPKGLAVDRDGIIYVVDSLFDNLQLFNRKGEYLLTVGKRGQDPGEFWLPSGAFIDTKGVLYVCDTYNSRVQMFRTVEDYDKKRR